ncbi:hypothetical protein F5888DRAFT_762813 [Russula emetica]|nr:hypothetical protein F5888DRAFT_762813 [Russula emetica]
MCPDTHRVATTQCQYPGCTKPVWRDPDGSYSSFCGNAHRFAMASNPRSYSRTCKNCNVKPVYIENGQAHDFCGRRCAGEFNNNGRRSSPPPRDIMCIIPGCRNRAFLDADGKATKFCSHRHRLYVYWMVTAPKLLLIQHATNSAAVQRRLADVCLLCVALRVLSDLVLNQRFAIKLQGNANS